MTTIIAVNTKPTPFLIFKDFREGSSKGTTLVDDDHIFLFGKFSEIRKYLETHTRFCEDNDPVFVVHKLIEMEIRSEPQYVGYPIHLFHFQGGRVEHTIIK